MTVDYVETPGHRIFRREATRAGFAVRDYRGRDFYHGPAVEVDSIAEVERLRREVGGLGIRWDRLGLDFIVYPA